MENNALIQNKNVSLSEVIEILESFKLDALLKVVIENESAFMLFKSGELTNVKFSEKSGEEAIKDILKKTDAKEPIFNIFLLDYEASESKPILFKTVEKYANFSETTLKNNSDELLALAIFDGKERALLSLSINKDTIDTEFIVSLSDLFLSVIDSEYIKEIDNLSKEETELNNDSLVNEISLKDDFTLKFIKRVKDSLFVLFLFNEEKSKNKVFALKTINKISSEFEAIE